MAKLFKFDVVTPTRNFYQDEVEMIVFETEARSNGGYGKSHSNVDC